MSFDFMFSFLQFIWSSPFNTNFEGDVGYHSLIQILLCIIISTNQKIFEVAVLVPTEGIKFDSFHNDMIKRNDLIPKGNSVCL